MAVPGGLSPGHLGGQGLGCPPCPSPAAPALPPQLRRGDAGAGWHGWARPAAPPSSSQLRLGGSGMLMAVPARLAAAAAGSCGATQEEEMEAGPAAGEELNQAGPGRGWIQPPPCQPASSLGWGLAWAPGMLRAQRDAGGTSATSPGQQGGPHTCIPPTPACPWCGGRRGSWQSSPLYLALRLRWGFLSCSVLAPPARANGGPRSPAGAAGVSSRPCARRDAVEYSAGTRAEVAPLALHAALGSCVHAGLGVTRIHTHRAGGGLLHTHTHTQSCGLTHAPRAMRVFLTYTHTRAERWGRTHTCTPPRAGVQACRLHGASTGP